jgi:hypothetical protein
MKLKIKEGTTSKLVKIFIQDSSATDGSGLTGLVYNSAGLSAYYIPEGDASAASITLATATVGTYTSGGFKEVDATNMPGVYELGLPDAVIDSTSEGSSLVMLKGATDMAPVLLEIELDTVDYRSSSWAQLMLSAGQIISGTVSTGTTAATTLLFAASDITEATSDHYNGRVVIFTSGNLAGQASTITDYVLTSGEGVFTVDQMTEAPANTDTFVVV